MFAVPHLPRWSLLALGVLSVACATEYPLSATFCDDWCHATLACGESPSNCVSECELTKTSGECFERQEDLLECYSSASSDDFACLERGFQPDTVVVSGACQLERDALFECTAPGIGVCLQLCRQTQRSQLDQVIDPNTGRLRPLGDEHTCPLLDQPCEDICWTVFSFTSAGLAAAGVVPDLPDPPTSDAGVDSSSGSLSCLQAVLLGCFLPMPGDVQTAPSASSEADTVESSAGAAPPSLGALLNHCIE